MSTTSVLSVFNPSKLLLTDAGQTCICLHRLYKMDESTVNKLGFQKEVFFYSAVVPEFLGLEQNVRMQQEDVLNLFPLYYGASLNFDDDNAIIVMEDIRKDNFQMSYLGRNGLDYNHTQIVLKELGRFHATGIALKMAKPDIFKTKLKTAAQPSLQNSTNPERNKINLQFRDQLKLIISSIPECVRYADKLDSMLENIDKKPLPEIKEPFATLLHNDLWTNNILFQYDNGKPKAVKFIDFQTTIYNSPVRDLVYFIFTSTEERLQQEFNTLMEVYFNSFSDHLKRLNCNVPQFIFEKLNEEVKFYAITKIKHIILLFKSVCGGDFKSNEFNLELFKLMMKNLIIRFINLNWI